MSLSDNPVLKIWHWFRWKCAPRKGKRTAITHGDQTSTPESKVHGANMGPIWGRQDPGGPHVGPMNFAVWDLIEVFVTNVDYLVYRTVSFTHYAFQPNTSLRNKIRKRDVGYIEYWKRIVSSWLGNLLVSLNRIRANKTYIIRPFLWVQFQTQAQF